MPNIKLIDKWLLPFCTLFRDHRSFVNFKKIIYGFLAANNIYALTALVSSLYLAAKNYTRIDDYFKKGVFDLDRINDLMTELIAKEAPFYTVNDRILLCGDATKIPKQAKKDPAVKKAFIETEASSKRTGYVPCTTYGCLSAVCAYNSLVFSMFLSGRICEGNEELEAWKGKKRFPQTVKMIQEAVKALKILGRSAYLALDRYYLGRPLLDALKEYNDNRAPGDPKLDVVTRAKINCKVYEDHESDPDEAKRVGAPIKYDPNKASDIFILRKDEFHELKFELDGVMTTQNVYSKVMKWGRGKDKVELKFVFSQRGDEKIILVSTDLNLSEQEIIEAYARRFTIEVAFRQGSEIFGMFNSHFHTHCLEELDFYAKKDDPRPVSKITSEEDKRKVLATARASEGFVLHSMLAMNLARLYQISCMEDPKVRSKYLRTYSADFSLQEAKQEISTGIICSLTRGEIKEINSLLSQSEPPQYETKEHIITDRGKKRRIRRAC